MRIAVLALLAACGGGRADALDASSADARPTHERLYVGTGEYDGVADWHGVLRFEAAEAIDGTVDPDAIIPIKQSEDAAGVRLNFAHGAYLREDADELYLATLFTNPDNTECRPCANDAMTGSIAVLSGASTADGPQAVTRHLRGDATGIVQPHGLWVDEASDQLWLANTFGGALEVFDDASSVDGDTAPSRVITHASLGAPVFVFHEPGADRLFVASKPDGPGTMPSILIFNHASTIDGDVAPDVRLMGPTTRIGAGNNNTTHNVWFDPARELLFVGHHTNEVLIFDLAGVELDPPAPTDLDLAPRVLETQPTAGALAATSVYGLFYLSAEDRLYVATGNVSPDSDINAVRVWDGVSDPSISGMVPPDRVISWPRTTYWPPQALWVQRY